MDTTLENPTSTQDIDVLMVDDMGDIELGDVDLIGLEDACRNKTFHGIAPKKIHLIKDILIKSKSQSRLGIINCESKEANKSLENPKRET